MAFSGDGLLVSVMHKGNRSSNSGAVSNRSSSILGIEQSSRLRDRYELGDEVGVGQFGKIRYCTDNVTGDVLACKSIAKERLVTSEDVKSVKLEIEIMSALSGHPNVVSLKAVFEEEEYVHLVMELCAGGELFERLQEHGRYSEPEAARVFKPLMEVVRYCHDHGVVHRDLKPENILLTNKSPSSPIKLADFGLATYFTPGQKLHRTVGSPFYIAPEVLSGGYNQAADVWSAGVILYILLSGIPPFWGKTKSEIFDAVREAKLQFPKDTWGSISNAAKDLISRMLCTDPKKRLTSIEVLEHPWITNHVGLCQVERENRRSIFESFDAIQSEAAASTPSLFDYNSKADVHASFSTKSSFSGFLVSDEAVHAASGSFAFPNSSKAFGSESIPMVPNTLSFAFPNIDAVCRSENSLSLSDDKIQVQLAQRASSLGQIFAAAVSSSLKMMSVGEGKKQFHKELQSSKNLLSHKGNHTIGLGELEQLNLKVSDSIIRWASCTHLSTSIQSPLVC
eukprot:TRINITY_DN3564_c0_g2_i1.p1 TRINITY_DN3564_c0_g2~~TRINITY_DN3564_c0_g2_i1.p1  ORF type:complete len:509 (+),score=84.69 TRINITY_DN3564_c0_g2_i1:367-1893(+)